MLLVQLTAGKQAVPLELRLGEQQVRVKVDLLVTVSEEKPAVLLVQPTAGKQAVPLELRSGEQQVREPGGFVAGAWRKKG